MYNLRLASMQQTLEDAQADLRRMQRLVDQREDELAALRERLRRLEGHDL